MVQPVSELVISYRTFTQTVVMETSMLTGPHPSQQHAVANLIKPL